MVVVWVNTRFSSDYGSFFSGRFDRLFATENPRRTAPGIRCIRGGTAVKGTTIRFVLRGRFGKVRM